MDQVAKQLENEHDLGLRTTHGVKLKDQEQRIERRKPREKEVCRCPLLHTLCDKECALYDNGKCAVVTGAKVHTGGRCPFSGSNSGRRCIPNCPISNFGTCGFCGEKKGVQYE